MMTLRIEVIAILEEGKCNYGHKKGHMYNYPEDKGNFCLVAWTTLFSI